MTAPWLKRDADGNHVLCLHVQPGAGKTAIAGLHGNALKIRLAARPVAGKANAALIAFVAAELGVARSAVELIGGATSREKRLRVRGASDEAVARLVSGAA